MTDDARRAPAATRNREPILDVLRRHLPARGQVLEIASGTGEHIVHFAQSLPGLDFQPSDPDADARASIAAWTLALGLTNVRPPLALAVETGPWPVAYCDPTPVGGPANAGPRAQVDAVLCINMVHIAPWAATIGLISGAARVLAAGGLLFVYGPYRCDGHMAPSNDAFDQSLRARNPAWGVRDLEAVTSLARSHGFTDPVIVPMPANNLSLIFVRSGGS